ncbi:MAG: hypothetical protein VKK04_00380 [Synechococcales bacterium]|nr:hypothetical protein [Synechococcales bacterium]
MKVDGTEKKAWAIAFVWSSQRYSGLMGDRSQQLGDRPRRSEWPTYTKIDMYPDLPES